ncbi:MAG: glycosyltransferase family 4 protein [Candidatus Tectomicrobia bacterium]|uniref:Glycosyltransferase family 4 protein n=1 Tax=Tectimicrobiota bacterium TaxID=2528274 RepID=A0A932CPR7_UNCTE|nr:glycosyltransferase family 4 protein [Candidatus Tectomicrobia bacterium]
MRVLHLFSDWRWTGPAEPVVTLCQRLQERGWEISLACRKPPHPHPQNLEEKALARGLRVTTQFHLNRYFAPWENLSDLRRLPRYLEAQGIDLLHVHLSHDHFLGAMAVARCRRPVALIRTNHKGVPLPHPRWNRTVLARFTRHLVVLSREAQVSDRLSFGLPAERVSLVYGAIDTERFAPRERNPEFARSLGLNGKGPVLGIVARMQRRRRFPQFLEAVDRARPRLPGLQVLIVGRGTHADEVQEKARELGLGETVLFPGYRDGDYLQVLACLDAKAYLVPGSDGSCRAVMEAMAMGIPVVAARRGVLPELVEDGINGLIIDPDTPESLAEGMVRIFQDEDRRRAMGAAARQRMITHFSLARQVEQVEQIYRALLGDREQGTGNRGQGIGNRG